MITFDRLRETLIYCPKTGLFTCRIERKSGTGRVMCAVGDQVGTMHRNGRLRIRVDGSDYWAHRLAWLYMTGAWPKGEVDHRNRIKSDNAWPNLRDFTSAANKENRIVASARSKTGLLGVIVDRRGRFASRIRANGKTAHLGCFGSAEEAHAAYLSAKLAMHPGFAP